MTKSLLFDCYGVLYTDRDGVNANLFAYIRDRLVGSYAVGMMSNASLATIENLFSSDELALFDPLILSKEVGFSKPEPQIYMLAQERLGVAFSEIIFVDDREDFLVTARDLGMQTVHYVTFDQCIRDLDFLLHTR